MAQEKTKAGKSKEYTVEEKLKALFNLQKVDSQTDKIKILRGELPLEVQDLEDEIAGLGTRVDNYKGDLIRFLKKLNIRILRWSCVIKGLKNLHRRLKRKARL